MRPAGRSMAALVGPDDLIRHAARLLAPHHQSRFPVVGDDGKPLGIVTRVGVFDAFAR
jgi:CBS domain-containing protein